MTVSRLILAAVFISSSVSFAEESFHDRPTSDQRPQAEAVQKGEAEKEAVKGAVDSIAAVSDMLQGRTRKSVGERKLPSDYEFFPGQIRP